MTVTASRSWLLEHALGAQVVPEAVHRRLVADRLRELGGERVEEPLGGGGVGDDPVVAGDAAGLVVAHAVDDQLELVLEVVVDDAVAELELFAISRRLVRA